MVMLISLNTSFSVLDIKVKSFEFFQHDLINRNTMISNYDAAIEPNITYKLTPLVLINILDGCSFSGVDT